MADDTLPFPPKPRPVATKRCKKCRKTKPLTEFHYRPEQMRHRAECKDCYRARANELRDPIENRRRVREWIKANPEKHLEHGRQTHERRRSDVGRWLASTLRATRARCKRKSVSISIVAADLIGLYKIQSGRCALTDRELVYGSKGKNRDSISIDRIEPALGYIVGNVRLITYQANMARGMFSDEELFSFCEAVLATRAPVCQIC